MSDENIGRRGFLQAAAGTAAFTILKPQLVRGMQANSAVRVGLLGCGGRGTTHIGDDSEEHRCARDRAGGHVSGPAGQRETAGRQAVRGQRPRRRRARRSWGQRPTSRLSSRRRWTQW